MEEIVECMNTKRDVDLRLKEFIDLYNYNKLDLVFVDDGGASYKEIDISKHKLLDDFENNFAYLYKLIMLYSYEKCKNLSDYKLTGIKIDKDKGTIVVHFID